MPDMILVKPKVSGAIVRNPQRNFRPLKAEGELVPNAGYWIRRLRSGCVVEVAAPREAAADDPAEATPTADEPATPIAA